MKIRYLIYPFVACLLFYSCNKTSSVGLEIQPQEDKITALVDTFYISSKDSFINAISAQCLDSASMLLGNYSSEKYGEIKADLLVQLASPVGYEFPPAQHNPKADSLVLYMYYSSFFGLPNEPFEISIYELNKKTPDYNTAYLTDLNANDFLDINNSQLLGKKITTSALKSSVNDQNEKETYVPKITYKFSDEQTQRFFDIPHSAYSSIQSFLNVFKGLYITTSYGKSTMLYLFEIDLKLFYHYSYQTKTVKGLDTTIRVNNHINYPASKDVRQLNLFKKKDVLEKINRRDTVDYITTTFGVYPKITIPVEAMRQRIKNNLPHKDIKRQVFINSANISVEATELDLVQTGMKPPIALCIVPVSEIENFIKGGGMRLYRQDKSQIAMYNETKKEYAFDIAYLINNIIKKEEHNLNAEYLLIPVDYYSSSDGHIVDIRIAKKLGAMTMRSGKNKTSPLRIELIYSGM